MKEIRLNKGYVTLIDDEDFERVSQSPWKWYVLPNVRKNGSVRCIYAARRIPKNGKRMHEYMHRFILGVTDPKMDVDHINHDSLDNRRANLRPATRAENLWNQKLLSSNTSGFTGVMRSASKKNPWFASIRNHQKTRYLGMFPTKEAAAMAYAKAARELRGEFAYSGLLKEGV